VPRLRVRWTPSVVSSKGKLHRGVDAITFHSVVGPPQWQSSVQTFRGKRASFIFGGDSRSGVGTRRPLLRGGRNLLPIGSYRFRVNLAFRFLRRLA
jgi:hypothetical protein